MKAAKVILATLLAGAISILIAVFGQSWLGDRKAPNIELPGYQASAADQLQRLPAFGLPNLDGQEIHSSTWAGKVLVLNFWASWCPPCQRELPIFEAAQAGNQDLRVVGIAIDTQEEVARYLADHPVSYTILIGGIEAVEMSRRLGNRLQGLPFTAIFDGQGKRVHSQGGEITPSFLEERLAPLLAKAAKARGGGN